MDSLSKTSITKLARRAGVKSLTEDSYDTIRNLCSLKLLEAVHMTAVVNNVCGTKTITPSNVYEALRLKGDVVARSKYTAKK